MITRLYAQLLRLYPQAFYALFAQEMADVFDKGWRDACCRQTLLHFCLKEFGDLPMNILQEHWITLRQRPMSQVEGARWVTRISCFFLLMLYWGVNRPLANRELGYAIFFLLNLIPLGGLVMAFRWERTGGIITLFGTALVWVWTFLGSADLLHNVPLALFAATLYCLPYTFNGAMFTYLGFRQNAKRKSKNGDV
jgi:hypothetical protein